jgi:hypothetical protein
MYKFTNGVVCYDIETRDKYIKAGMTLVKEEKPEIKEEKEVVKEDNKDFAKRNEDRISKKRTGRFNRVS